MEVVFCVMKDKELISIYGTAKKAEEIATHMTEKYNEKYYVETRTVL